MPSDTDPTFTAAPSALGYFYQVRYALALLIRERNPESVISIEKLDDIAFEQAGEPVELLQTKHRIVGTGSLTDSSLDLWKTIRVWVTAARAGLIDLSSVILSLITTGQAPPESAAASLRSDSRRDPTLALRRLQAAGEASMNEAVRRAYAEFQKLSPQEREILVGRIRVLDASPDIRAARNLLERELSYVTRPQFLTLLCDRLEGWWFSRIIEHLKDPATVPGIPEKWVRVQINDLAEQFRLDNLPNDFPMELDLDVSDLSASQRLFVEQLKLVLVGNERIKRAISDYHRAFEQRSRWVREDLLLDRDLEQYEDRLVREWQELFLSMQENLQAGVNPEIAGRNLYNQVIDMPRHIPIRPSFPDPFVMRGSFHILANDLKVGWHPEFKERLAQALERLVQAVA
jgi:hypothetical protein